ncbi:hypothetical protein CPB85DRAFT_1312925 [Mucidula mucida]|nr:hypothetical protein CPB85DRAFT_1312925 [Mucidula mucida]
MSGGDFRPVHFESTCTILTCTSEEFQDMYNDANLDDDVLLNIIRTHASSRPTRAGRRYVAVALHIAHRKGADAVVGVARAWMDHLFLMMLSISRASYKVETPTFDERDSSELRATLGVREGYRCAITRSFDRQRVLELMAEGREDEIPEAPQSVMAAVHIMPLLLNSFIDRSTTERARTWDMLRSWTGLDMTASDIHTPANTILMTLAEHLAFARFQLYFDKEAFPNEPNKYRVRPIMRGLYMSSGKREADVEFNTMSEVDPPNPDFLRIHAAFAKVLHLSGAADRFEWDDDDERELDPHRTFDFAQDLSRRLVISAM